MANCKYCGTWAGVFWDKHQECDILAAGGKTAEEIKAVLLSPRPAAQLTAAGVFWAVFGALWLFSVSAAVVYGVIRFIDMLN